MSDPLSLPMVTFYDLYLRIAPKSIVFLKFILEGYDGLALVTTIDRHNGIVRLVVPSQRHDELWYLLGELAPGLLNI